MLHSQNPHASCVEEVEVLLFHSIFCIFIFSHAELYVGRHERHNILDNIKTLNMEEKRKKGGRFSVHDYVIPNSFAEHEFIKQRLRMLNVVNC